MADPLDRVFVRGRDGTVVSIPRDQAQAYQNRYGGGLATPEDIEQQRRVNRAEASPVTSALEGAGDSLTLGGLSRLRLSPMYGGLPDDEAEELRKDMLARSQTTAGQAGAFAGIAATGLAGAGKSAVARAISLTPGGILARAAGTAGEAMAARAAAAGAGRVLAGTVGLGAEGLVEGAVSGASQALTESTLTATPLTAEKLLAGAAIGGVTGVALGAPLGAGVGAVKAGVARATRGLSTVADAIDTGAARLDDFAASTPKAPRSTDDFAPSASPDVAPEARPGFEVPDPVANAISVVSGADAAAIKRNLSLTDEGFRRRDHFRNADAYREKHVKSVTDDVDSMIDAEDTIRDVLAGELKTANVASDVKRSAETVAASRQQARALNEFIETTIKENRIGINKRDVQQIREWTQRLASNESLDEAELFIAHDRARRALFTWTKKAESTRATSPTDAIAIEETARKLREAAERTRLFLQDEDVWGLAAQKQARRNAAAHELFDTTSDWQRRFTVQTGELKDAAKSITQKKTRADRGLVDSYMGGLVDYRKSADHASTTRSLTARRKLLDAIIENGDVTGDDLARVTRARDAVTRAESSLSQAAEVIGDANEIKGMRGGDGLGSVMGGALGGGMIGGPIGTIAGAVAGAATNPYNVVRAMSVLDSLSGRVAGVDERVKGLGRFLRSAGEKTPKALRKAARGAASGARAASRGVRGAAAAPGRVSARYAPRVGAMRRAAVSAGVRAFGATPEERRRTFNRVVDSVDLQVASAEYGQRHRERIAHSIADIAPATAAMLGQKQSEAVRYLASVAPRPSSIVGRSAQPHLHKPKITDAQIASFARTVSAIENPLGLMDELKDGTLTREHVSALRTVYPGLFAEMQMAALGALAQTDKPLPYQLMLQVALMLDIPGHPSLTPEFIARHQQLVADTGGEPEAGPVPTTATPTKGMAGAVKAARSPLDRINSVL